MFQTANRMRRFPPPPPIDPFYTDGFNEDYDVLYDRPIPEYREGNSNKPLRLIAETEKKVNLIDLSRVEAKLSLSVEKGGKGWDRDRINNSVSLYRKTLVLMAVYSNRGETIVPITADVDEVWHTHILDTLRYHNDCNFIVGHYIHHTPVSGQDPRELKSLLKSLRETCKIFKKEFGELPDKIVNRADCSPVNNPSCCGGTK